MASRRIRRCARRSHVQEVKERSQQGGKNELELVRASVGTPGCAHANRLSRWDDFPSDLALRRLGAKNIGCLFLKGSTDRRWSDRTFCDTPSQIGQYKIRKMARAIIQLPSLTRPRIEDFGASTLGLPHRRRAICPALWPFAIAAPVNIGRCLRCDISRCDAYLGSTFIDRSTSTT